MADENHAAEIADLEKQVSELEGKLEKLGKSSDNDDKKVAKSDDVGDDVEKSDDSSDDDDKTVKRVRLTKKKASDTDAVAKGKKSKADDADDEEEDLKDDADDETTEKQVKKAADDESVVIEGQQIFKSKIGEASFTILKAQSDRLEKAEKDIAKERDLRETAEFQKRADDLYKHVPGTVEERGEMLKAISKMDKGLKKSFETVLANSEKIAKAAFDRVGVSGQKDEGVKKGAQDFEAKVQEIKKRDNCSRADAMTKARAEHEELFKAYQASN